MHSYTVKVINENLKIFVPTTDIIKAQLENAAAKGTDMSAAIENKNKQLIKKLNKIINDVEKLQVRMSQNGYSDSVPESIQEKNKQVYH